MVKLISQLHKNICKKPFCFGWINPCCATHQLPLDYPLQVHLHHRNMPLPPIHHNFFYSLCDNINTLMEMHAHLIVQGLTRDLSCSTKLVSLYGSLGRLDFARSVFDTIPDPDFLSWKVIIRWYFLNSEFRDIMGFYNRMRMCLKECDNVVFSHVLKACSESRDFDAGRKVHCQIVKFGTPDSFVFTGILVDACKKIGAVHQGKWLHGYLIKYGIELGSYLLTALLDMYAKCGVVRDARDARYIFETVSDRDVVAWNSIIYGFSQNGSAYEALELFHLMRMGSDLPDSVTSVSVLSACASLNALQVGSSFHAYTVKSGLLSSNVYVGTALLTFYAKCGDAESARIIFDGMDQKSTVTWSAMISGYGIQGNGCGSLSIFSDMLKAQLKPNEEIFTSILSACSHTGMVGEGWKLFTMICQDYNLVPSMRHYTCMVDLLARAGRLKEALDFLQKMPVQPDVSLFGAFLHGCGLHSRFDLGELAIKRMLELHPGEACYYVLICNLYASDGRWSKVKQVAIGEVLDDEICVDGFLSPEQ
ncbi:hypothetical protein OIU78_005185 [Salix suchowensis]|nr:hypothetical protein OIU78_005185 [Salix suchowensis]